MLFSSARVSPVAVSSSRKLLALICGGAGTIADAAVPADKPSTSTMITIRVVRPQLTDPLTASLNIIVIPESSKGRSRTLFLCSRQFGPPSSGQLNRDRFAHLTLFEHMGQLVPISRRYNRAHPDLIQRGFAFSVAALQDIDSNLPTPVAVQ